MTQQPQYHSIENLPLISYTTKGSFKQVKELTNVLKQAEKQPEVLTDTIINRAIKQYQEGLEFTPIFREQLIRWQGLKLSDSGTSKRGGINAGAIYRWFGNV